MSRLARAKERLRGALTEIGLPERRKAPLRFENTLQAETEIRKYEASYSESHRLARAEPSDKIGSNARLRSWHATC
jgi:hypothetical protein